LDLDYKYFEDVFVSKKEEDGSWGKPMNLGSRINTEGHEASIGLSADGQELYIYRDDFGDGNIYVCKMEGSAWSEPELLNENVNSVFRETHATVSADGQTLYFTSDRSGQGKMDLFRSRRLPTGQWAVAENLGETINTKYDEEAPFIHPDGKTLFFSSKGHNSMGGYDVFFSIEENGKWSTPVNIGHPVNTADDEYFFVMSTDGKRAYYSSGGDDGEGGKDIYIINLDTEIEVPLTVYKGEIVPDKSGKRPENVSINVTDNETGELFGTYKPRADNGKFVLILHPGKNYNIAYESDGYMFKSEKLYVPEETAYFEINRAIQLKPVSLNK
jgi:Tol biopolymer transport system component